MIQFTITVFCHFFIQHLLYHNFKNHAFLDGNKRIGAHAMLIFLIINDIELNYTQKELADVFLGLADGSVSEKDLLNWILSHEE